MPSGTWPTLAQQGFALRRVIPGAQCRVRRGHVLECELQVQTAEASRLYHVRLAYRLGERPQVWVVDPPLKSRDGSTSIPHMYSQTQGEICLHLPEEWDCSMWITEMIIPWISDWLFHYELWLAGGEWLGGGHIQDAA